MSNVAYFMNGVSDGAHLPLFGIRKNLNRRLGWTASNIPTCRACSFAGIDYFTIAVFLLSVAMIISLLSLHAQWLHSRILSAFSCMPPLPLWYWIQKNSIAGRSFLPSFMKVFSISFVNAPSMSQSTFLSFIVLASPVHFWRWDTDGQRQPDGHPCSFWLCQRMWLEQQESLISL